MLCTSDGKIEYMDCVLRWRFDHKTGELVGESSDLNEPLLITSPDLDDLKEQFVQAVDDWYAFMRQQGY